MAITSLDENKAAAPNETTFPKFLELPQELQDMIWEAAIFDSSATPGIHYLNVCRPPSYTQRRSSERKGKLRKQKRKTGKYDRHPAAIERTSTWSGFDQDWSEDLWDYRFQWRTVSFPADNTNDSAYLINSSLWCVSRGAREAIRRHGRLKKDWGSRVSASLSGSRSRPGRDPEAEFWYEWDTSTDLICIRGVVSPGDQRPSPWEICMTDPHEMGMLQADEDYSICSLALEFDPAWNPGTSELENMPASHFADSDALLAFRAWMWNIMITDEYVKELYIIDYRLKPRPGLSIRDLGKPKYTGSNGLYYVADVTGGNFDIPAVADVVPLLRDASSAPDTYARDAEILGPTGLEYRDLYRFISFVTWNSDALHQAELDEAVRLRIMARVVPP